MIIKIEIIHDDDAPWDCEKKEFKGDELTSPMHPLTNSYSGES